MSTTDALPEPVHAGSLLANDDVYLARDVRAALAAQAEEVARLTAERDALKALLKECKKVMKANVLFRNVTGHDLCKRISTAIDAARTGGKPGAPEGMV